MIETIFVYVPAAYVGFHVLCVVVDGFNKFREVLYVVMDHFDMVDYEDEIHTYEAPDKKYNEYHV